MNLLFISSTDPSVWIFWLYVFLLLFWFCLYQWRGDQLWWLALISPFATILFIPLIPLWLICLARGTGPLVVSLPLIPSLLVALAIFGRQFRLSRYSATSGYTQRGRASQAALDTNKTQREASSLSLMTFNCWWLSSPEAAVDVPFQNNLPDLVLFQELTPKVARHMNEALAGCYPYQVFSTSEQPSADRLGAISRFPIEELESRDLAGPNFRIQILRITMPIAPIQEDVAGEPEVKGSSKHPTEQATIVVYNIHPRATNVMRYWREGENLGQTVSLSFAERFRFVDRMIADIQGRHEPVIVAGDFNSTPLSDVYRLMSVHLNDAHMEYGAGLGNTFPAHTRDLHGLPIPWPIMRLDMIFGSPKLSCLETHVGKSNGDSDHLPVIATFEIPNP